MTPPQFCRLWRILSCLLLGSATLAHGQTATPTPGPITLQLSSPLALTEKPLALAARFGRWVPLAINLRNTGDAVKGRVSMVLTVAGERGERPGAEVYADVDLPSQANKTIWLYNRVETEDANALDVTFSGRGFKQLQEKVGLTVEPPGSRFVLTVSDSEERLTYLTGLTGAAYEVRSEMPPGPAGPASPNAPQKYVWPLGCRHEGVPNRWIGLDAVHLVVLQDFAHGSLLPGQLEALRGYVAGGGTLVVLGGSRWQQLAQSPMADLWPMTPSGSTPAPAGGVAYLAQRFAPEPQNGADRLGGAPVLAVQGQTRPNGRVLWSGGGTDDLLMASSGAGQVLFLPVDPTQPPFVGWRGNAALWQEIFALTDAAKPPRLESMDPSLSMSMSGPSRNYQNPDEESAAHGDDPTSQLLLALRSVAQLRTPPVAYIAWFLALYVFCLVPVNYVVLRYFDKRELAWVTIPAIVAVFSVLSYVAALRIKGNAVLTRHVNIVQTSAGSGVGRADALLWLFSPRKTTYTVTSDNPQMAVADFVAGAAENASPVTIHEPDENSAFSVEDAAIYMWDYRSFAGHTIVNLGRGIKVRGDGVISNDTPLDLRGVVLVRGGLVQRYGDIRSGGSAAQARSSDAVPAGSFSLVQGPAVPPTVVRGPGRQLAGSGGVGYGRPAGSGFGGGHGGGMDTGDIPQGSSDGIHIVDPAEMGRIERASSPETIFPSASSTTDIPHAMLTAALGGDFGKSKTPPQMLIGWTTHSPAQLTIGDVGGRAEDLTLVVCRLPG